MVPGRPTASFLKINDNNDQTHTSLNIWERSHSTSSALQSTLRPVVVVPGRV